MASRKKAPPTVVLSELLSSPCIAGIEVSAFAGQISIPTTSAAISDRYDSNAINPETGTPFIKEGVPDTGTPEMDLDTFQMSDGQIQTGPDSEKATDFDNRFSRIGIGVPDTITGVPVSETGALDTRAPITETRVPENLIARAFSEGLEYVVTRRQKLIPARTVQLGHTQGEQLVYETLWRLAKPAERANRKLTIGVGSLAPQVPISYNNCQANLRSLAEKLAIEQVFLEQHVAHRQKNGRLAARP